MAAHAVQLTPDTVHPAFRSTCARSSLSLYLSIYLSIYLYLYLSIYLLLPRYILPLGLPLPLRLPLLHGRPQFPARPFAPSQPVPYCLSLNRFFPGTPFFTAANLSLSLSLSLSLFKLIKAINPCDCRRGLTWGQWRLRLNAQQCIGYWRCDLSCHTQGHVGNQRSGGRMITGPVPGRAACRGAAKPPTMVLQEATAADRKPTTTPLHVFRKLPLAARP